MIPILTRTRIYFLVLLVFTALFSCRKSASFSTGLENKNSTLKLIRAEFIEQQIDTALITEVPSQLGVSIIWKPLWNKLTERIENDSITYFYIPLVAESKNSITKTSSTINTSRIQKFLQISRKENSFEFKLATYLLKDSLAIANKKSTAMSKVSDLIVQDIRTKQSKYYGSGLKRSTTSRDYCRWIFYCEYWTGCEMGMLTGTVNESYCKCPDEYFRDCAENQGCNAGAWFLIGYQVIEICEPDPDFPPEPPLPVYNIFARLEETNFQISTYSDAGGFHEIHTYDTYLRFYNNQACTIPTGVDPAIAFNYKGIFQWTTTANYGQSNGSWPYVRYAPHSATTSIYLGPLRIYQMDQYDDPAFGQVTEETNIGWETTSASNYEYYPLPTILY
ncbi:MAG: hypothetical protein ABW007_17025 [Chitinophagaceae bacterium]